MTVGEAASLIVATTGLIGLFLAHRLGLLGQKKDAQQQAAATKLQERIASFDELESLNDRLGIENTRLRAEADHLRTLIVEAESRGDMRLAAQGRRCRETLDRTLAAMVSLQSVVVAEMSRASTDETVRKAREHLASEHPDDEAPDL